MGRSRRCPASRCRQPACRPRSRVRPVAQPLQALGGGQSVVAALQQPTVLTAPTVLTGAAASSWPLLWPGQQAQQLTARQAASQADPLLGACSWAGCQCTEGRRCLYQQQHMADRDLCAGTAFAGGAAPGGQPGQARPDPRRQLQPGGPPASLPLSWQMPVSMVPGV